MYLDTAISSLIFRTNNNSMIIRDLERRTNYLMGEARSLNKKCGLMGLLAAGSILAVYKILKIHEKMEKLESKRVDALANQVRVLNEMVKQILEGEEDDMK